MSIQEGSSLKRTLNMSEISTSNDISVVIVNYRTPDLLDKAARSFRRFYPEVEMVLVDNGSNDRSAEVIDSIVALNPAKTRKLMLERNYFHGPAMDTAIHTSTKDVLFFLDTDTETYNGGFIEQMLSELNSGDNVYGVGRRDRVNKRGFATERGKETILISAYMMLKRDKYLRLPPFIHHGMPTLENFSTATTGGLELRNFDIESYIHHQGRGTASKFGYGLGVRGRLDYILNKVGL